MKATNTSIGLVTLILLITSAIDSVRNLPTTALFGPSLIFFFILGALFFLLPIGLVSAELSSTWSDKGGIYQWTKLAFGEKVGVFAIWLQVINTLVWYPTILSFIAGTATYLYDPSLGQNKLYLVIVVIAIFWLMTLINLRGLNVSARFASLCGLFGMVIPMALIVILGLIWMLTGKSSEVTFTAATIFPGLHQGQNWISLTAIITSFLGIELATVHVKNIKSPQRNFPRALIIAIIFILFTMIFGSLAIAIVLPAKDINLVNGIMEAFAMFLRHYHLAFLLPLLTVMIIFGSLGSLINWIISPARGLLQAAQNGYLPTIFAHENKHGAPAAVLISQAILVTIFCLAFLLMPSVNGSYWLLTDLSTELYLLMYVMMLFSAIRIKQKYTDIKPEFRALGNDTGFHILCILGLMGCGISLFVGFLPPDNIDVGTPLHYVTTFTTALIVMLLPILGLYGYKKLTSK
jgi:amino acid transporter